ncbi:putative sigma-70 factor, ECF subfamily [Pseudomonas aeruginosa]|nr:putative sigma-70 factor, ECF subfamily [Pseudomonas aeruginosa]
MQPATPAAATLYLDKQRQPAKTCSHPARRRLESAIGTLSVLDLLDETEEPGESICRITGSLLSLLSDALSLFEAEYARRPPDNRRRRCPPARPGGGVAGRKRGSLSALARQLRGRAKATCPLRTPTQAIPDDDRSFHLRLFLHLHSSPILRSQAPFLGASCRSIPPSRRCCPHWFVTTRNWSTMFARRFGDRGMARGSGARRVRAVARTRREGGRAHAPGPAAENLPRHRREPLS